MILSRIVKCFLDHTAQSGAVHVKLASQTLRRVLVAVWTNLVQCLSLTNYILAQVRAVTVDWD